MSNCLVGRHIRRSACMCVHRAYIFNTVSSRNSNSLHIQPHKIHRFPKSGCPKRKSCLVLGARLAEHLHLRLGLADSFGPSRSRLELYDSLIYKLPKLQACMKRVFFLSFLSLRWPWTHPGWLTLTIHSAVSSIRLRDQWRPHKNFFSPFSMHL